MMPTAKEVWIRWSHRYGYQPGVWAQIQGVKMVIPEGLPPRLCYHVWYQEKATWDYIPISDSDNYEIEAR